MKALNIINYLGRFYYIDVKLKEFREMDTAKPVKFFTTKGEEILTRAIKKELISQDELNEIF
jgi:hypothetical protein